jgi:hypothetical protein
VCFGEDGHFIGERPLSISSVAQDTLDPTGLRWISKPDNLDADGVHDV